MKRLKEMEQQAIAHTPSKFVTPPQMRKELLEKSAEVRRQRLKEIEENAAKIKEEKITPKKSTLQFDEVAPKTNTPNQTPYELKLKAGKKEEEETEPIVPKRNRTPREVLDMLPNPSSYPRTREGLVKWTTAVEEASKIREEEVPDNILLSAVESRIRAATKRWPSKDFGSITNASNQVKKHGDKAEFTGVDFGEDEDEVSYEKELAKATAAIHRQYEGRIDYEAAKKFAEYVFAKEEYDEKTKKAKKHIEEELLPQLGMKKPTQALIKLVYNHYSVPRAPRMPAFLAPKKAIGKPLQAKQTVISRAKRTRKPKATVTEVYDLTPSAKAVAPKRTREEDLGETNIIPRAKATKRGRAPKVTVLTKVDLIPRAKAITPKRPKYPAPIGEKNIKPYAKVPRGGRPPKKVTYTKNMTPAMKRKAALARRVTGKK